MRVDDKNQFFGTCSMLEHDSYRNWSRVISFHEHSDWQTCARFNFYVDMEMDNKHREEIILFSWEFV